MLLAAPVQQFPFRSPNPVCLSVSRRPGGLAIAMPKNHNGYKGNVKEPKISCGETACRGNNCRGRGKQEAARGAAGSKHFDACLDFCTIGEANEAT